MAVTKALYLVEGWTNQGYWFLGMYTNPMVALNLHDRVFSSRGNVYKFYVEVEENQVLWLQNTNQRRLF